MKKIKQRKWRPDELREATLGLLDEEGLRSGYWGACSIDPQWLIDRGFPEAFVLPMVEDFEYKLANLNTLIIKHDLDGTQYPVSHVRAVSFLSMLRALANVFGVDTTDADRTLGRKASARLLAAGIKKAIAEEEKVNPKTGAE